MVKLKNRILLILVSSIILLLAGYIGYSFYEQFQILECKSIKSCKACANSFGCLWCSKSNICVSDLSNNELCPGESTVADPLGCDVVQDTTSEQLSDNTSSPLFGGKCENNKDCNTCLSSPDCFWCATNKICSSSIHVYDDCNNDKNIYNSLEQCTLNPTVTPTTPPATQSIIPILGLSRNTDGSLTQASLEIIFDSFGSRGTPIIDLVSKNAALEEITKEISFYESLPVSSDTKKHLMDLQKVSGFIEGTTVSKYKEGYQDFAYSNYENEKIKNKNANSILQGIWIANLITLGALFYYIRK